MPCCPSILPWARRGDYWISLPVALDLPKISNVKSSKFQLPILRKQPLSGVGLVPNGFRPLIPLTWKLVKSYAIRICRAQILLMSMWQWSFTGGDWRVGSVIWYRGFSCGFISIFPFPAWRESCLWPAFAILRSLGTPRARENKLLIFPKLRRRYAQITMIVQHIFLMLRIRIKHETELASAGSVVVGTT